jgi:heat shock protein HslJ
MAELRGRIARRPNMEGTGEEDVIVVEEFNKVSPGQTCGGAGGSSGSAPATSLENVDWKLISLGNDTVPQEAVQNEPYLHLVADGHKVQGSGGCNRFFGSYQLAGESLSFSAMGATRMACAKGMDIEMKLTQALGATSQWTIAGGNLELRDAGGKVLARFEPRAPK